MAQAYRTPIRVKQDASTSQMAMSYIVEEKEKKIARYSNA